MIHPIVMYGAPVLRKKAKAIPKGSDEVKVLSADMFETMSAAQGIGLAAPQIGRNIRLFVVDDSPLQEDPEPPPFKKVFINPEIVQKSENLYEMHEGCLSIPDIREKVRRSEKIRIKFFDTDWKHHEEEYEGMRARIIQHEYDHIEGVLFLDYLEPIKKRLLKKQLTQISKGEVDVTYRISAPAR